MQEIADKMGFGSNSDWQVDENELIEYCPDSNTGEIESIYWSVKSITEMPGGSYKISIYC